MSIVFKTIISNSSETWRPKGLPIGILIIALQIIYFLSEEFLLLTVDHMLHTDTMATYKS